ncbi:MAG: class I tRNA ligase family protein [Clostridia bacterium]
MYNKSVDEKWQKIWDNAKCFNATNDYTKKKFYGLIEFPYPSGAGMHVGHIRAYMGMDVIARKRRLEGYNVLFPIGFDAFGLPTENYAIKTGIHPRKVTDDNIKTFTKQLKSIGFSFDFDRVIDTTDPNYFKWTQWIFLKLFENGLAYKDKTLVNYCPNCKVILANEESQGGKCDRCDCDIVQKEKEVWMLKITEYADKLLDGLDEVDFAPRVRLEQENWIGRSFGVQIDFKIKDSDKNITIFTTRPDTIMGATYMAIAPEHPLLEELKDRIDNYIEIDEYRKTAKKKSEFERVELAKNKTGVEVRGISVVNPINNELIPLFVTDYVMMGYGTGAIMAVPAHDTRDFEFAKKFKINIKQVIAPIYISSGNDKPRDDKEYSQRNNVSVIIKHSSEDKYIVLDWIKMGWKSFVSGGIEPNENIIDAAIREMTEETGYYDVKEAHLINAINKNIAYIAHKDVNRVAMHYPVYIELASQKDQAVEFEDVKNHSFRWVNKDELLNTLNVDNQIFMAQMFLNETPFIDTESGVVVNSSFLDGLCVKDAKEKIIKYLEENNLGKRKVHYHMKDWAFARQRYWGEPVPIIKCDKCGLVALEEKDLPLTLPEIDDFIPGEDGESPLANAQDWVNVKCPKCGNDAKRETDTMPQWAGSSWYFLRYIDQNNKEKFADMDKLKYWLSVDWYNGGMEHVTRHLIYSRFWHRFLYDIKLLPTKEPYAKRTYQGLILGPDGNKMSKSKGNVVNPDEIVNQYGADTLRTYILFIGDFSLPAPWSPNGVKGVKKFLDRVERLENIITQEIIVSKELEKELNYTIKKVTNDYETMKYNTAIAQMMTYVNLLYKQEIVSIKYIKPFLQVLNPIAPHLTEELWEKLGLKQHIYNSTWPKYDETKLIDDTIDMAVQINGVVKFKINVLSSLNEKEIEEQALNDERFNKIKQDKTIKKVIVIKSRIINVVLS